jgi:hypothetical protein
MGQHNIIILGVLLAPVLLVMLLRVNAALVFVSLCVGYVLAQFLGSDTQSFADLFVSHGASVSAAVMKLVLLLFPAVFTTVFMIGTVKKARLVLNILPALATGCLTVLLVLPLLPGSVSKAITDASAWTYIVRLQSAIVGAGALISMFFLWMQRPKHHTEEHAGKRH